MIWAGLGRYQEAVDYYDKALVLNLNGARICSNRCAALAKLHRYDEAVAHFDRALEVDPLNADAWYCRGEALRRLSRIGGRQKS
jgi:protein O-GlcNAc transferase